MTGAPLRVAVLGATGRLGGFACELFDRTEGFELVGRWRRADDWRESARTCGASVVFEATRAGLGFEHACALLELGLRPLVATSGVDSAEVEHLDRLARRLGLGGWVVPNFSLGAWLMQRAAELAAPYFEQIEIVESHHTRKADAPSGTAIDTARRIVEARERSGCSALSRAPSESSARGETREGVGLHSLRLAGVYARQEVVLSGPGELLAVRHEMGGPEAFGPGIVIAARAVATRQGVGVGLDALLGKRD